MCAARAYNHRRDGSPRHVIEHQFKPARLEPMDAPRQPQYVQPQPLILASPAMGQTPAAPTNVKADMMEMMMMQNAQMHQMMMQQLMLSAIPKPQKQGGNINVELDDVIQLSPERGRRRPPSVHHHHYSPPPGPPPMPQYTLPPIQMPPPMPTYYSPRHYDLEPLQQPKDYPSVIQQSYRRQQDY